MDCGAGWAWAWALRAEGQSPLGLEGSCRQEWAGRPGSGVPGRTGCQGRSVGGAGGPCPPCIQERGPGGSWLEFGLWPATKAKCAGSRGEPGGTGLGLGWMMGRKGRANREAGAVGMRGQAPQGHLQPTAWSRGRSQKPSGCWGMTPTKRPEGVDDGPWAHCL